jgi:hypothetical protein
VKRHSKPSIPRDKTLLGPIQNTQDQSDTPRDTRDLISDTSYNFYLSHDEHKKHERRRATARDERRCRPHGLWHAPNPPPGRARATRRRPGAATAPNGCNQTGAICTAAGAEIEKAAKSTKKRRRRGGIGRRRRRRRWRRCPACGRCPRRRWRRCRHHWWYLQGTCRVL